jgi:hypothetical protein
MDNRYLCKIYFEIIPNVNEEYVKNIPLCPYIIIHQMLLQQVQKIKKTSIK